MPQGVYISSIAIIKACNTETGSGGVLRWNKRVARTSIRKLRARAELGDPANHALPGRGGYEPGCYKGGFTWQDSGNGHITQTKIGNACPHAYFVEMGRAPSGGEEVFSTGAATTTGWVRVIAKHGSAGFRGNGTIYRTVRITAEEQGANLRSITSRRGKFISL